MIRTALRRLDRLEAEKGCPDRYRVYRIEELLPAALERQGRSAELPAWLAATHERDAPLAFLAERDPALAEAVRAQMRARPGILAGWSDWNL